MIKQTRLTAVATAIPLLALTACMPSDTGAEGLATELSQTLAGHTLEGVSLRNPEAASSFDSFIDPLRDYPLTVSPGEIDYDMNDAALPLTWHWEVEGNEWEYETTVDLVYDESQWWVIWKPDSLIPSLEDGERIGIDRTVPERAEILGAGAEPIITERSILRFGLDKTQVETSQMAEAAHDIAIASGVDPDGFTARVDASGPKAFVEAIAVRPEDVDSWIDEGFNELPGALVVSDEALLGPTPTFARELLGRSGEATAEIIEASDGEIGPGDIVGLSGLQKQYDEQLRGVGALEIFTVPASECSDPLDCDPQERTVLVSLEAGSPQDLHLTLDIDVQIAAEEALATLKESEDGLPGASLVAIQPSTGNVLAIANGEGNQGLNHAAVGQYPPGSTFKVVTALALLRSGLAVDDLVQCPDTTLVDGRVFKNYDAYPEEMTGEITFMDAFAESCNTALIELRDQISGEDLLQAAESLGFGLDLSGSELGFPAFLGTLPAPESGTPFAAALIGQGEVLASPLAMALVAASVQAGDTVAPILLEDSGSEVDVSSPLTEAEAQTLRELMEAVVTSGTATLLADLAGDPVRAKTGTAEHGGEGTDPHTWIIGAQGDLAAAVFVEAGVGGAETAGPVLKEFLTEAGAPE